jgi:hypothetical protein
LRSRSRLFQTLRSSRSISTSKLLLEGGAEQTVFDTSAGNITENNIEMLDESVNTSKLANERAGAVAPVAKIPEAYNKPASKYKRQIYTNAVNFRVSFLSK